MFDIFIVFGDSRYDEICGDVSQDILPRVVAEVRRIKPFYYTSEGDTGV